MGRRCIEIEDVECVKETDRALCLSIPDYEDEVWIPKSVVSEDSDVTSEGDEGRLIIHQWFADKEGLEGREYREL